MASFTPEEIDFIKCHGNEFCRKVWLGLYDSQKDQAEPDSRDEQKIKDFMAQKYERKRWYQAPTEAMKEEARQVNESATNRNVPTRPLKTILGDKTPKLVVQNQSPQTTPKNHAAQQPPPVSQPPVSLSSSPPGQQNQSSGSTTMDLLGDLGGDPFASSAPPAPQVATGGGGEDTNTLFPMSNTPISAAPAVNGGFPSFSPAQAPPSAPSGGESSASGGNKYSDLGDLFSTPATTESNTTALSWGGSTSSSGISWGGGGGSSSSGGIDWNSGGGGGTGMNWSSGGLSSTMGTTMNWNASSGSTSSMAPSHSAFCIPPSAYSYSQLGRGGNPFFSDSGGANPFGETTAATQSNVSNPFGGSAGGGQPSLFGNQPNAGFGQHSGGFGNQPTSVAGFGQQSGGFGNQPTSVAGFGSHTSTAGGYGTPTSAAGGFGAPQTSVARGFGPPASNPGTFNMGGFGQTSTAGGFGSTPTTGGFGQNPPAGNFGPPGGGFGGAGMSNQFHNQNGVFSSMGPSSTSGGFGTVSHAQTMPNQFGHSMPGQFDNKMGGAHGFPSGWGGQPAATSAQPVNPFLSTASQSMAPKSGSTNPFL
ncbi:uncharacterized protein LOC134228425 isoform X2 [Saccostrea cucullata]|uniref:uncharacterized protein LOC134228425 isoform X2 n=1 Tax=Saccostrea cuccullata TaxID=36930 RepID=UPI002ED28359